MAEETHKDDKGKDDHYLDDMLDLICGGGSGSSEADSARFSDMIGSVLENIPDPHPPLEDTDDPHEENRRTLLRRLVHRTVIGLTYDDILYMYGKHMTNTRTWLISEEPYFEHVKELFTVSSPGCFKVDPVIYHEVLKIVLDINHMRGYDIDVPWLSEQYDPVQVKNNQREWFID